MFGLKVSSLIKASGSDTFINMLPDARKKTDVNNESVNDKYNTFMSDALYYLGILSTNFTQENFEKAINNLSEAQKLKSNRPEPYFYLSWLFLFADETELALKYMKVTSVINPEFEGLDILRDKVSEVQLIDSKLQTEKTAFLPPVVTNTPKVMPGFNAARMYSSYNSARN